MGRTYGVPRSAKGESRILYIFTVKSLIVTIICACIGIIPYIILTNMGYQTAGFVVIGVLALIGYGIMSLKIPDTPMMGKFRRAGGEQLSDILVRSITFAKRKRIYLYRKGGKKQW